MPDLDDFYASKGSSGDSGSSGGGGVGCSAAFWTVVIITLLLWLLGQCSG